MDTAIGTYRSMTATEYSIELALAEGGRGTMDVCMWVAGAPRQADDCATLPASWSQEAGRVVVKFRSGESAVYAVVPCLPHEPHVGPGCSPGLRLLASDMPQEYELARYPLWRADGLP